MHTLALFRSSPAQSYALFPTFVRVCLLSLYPSQLPPPPNALPTHTQLPSRVAHNWSSMLLSSLLSVLTAWYFPHQGWASSGGLLLPNGLQLFIDRKGVGWSPPQ